MRRLVEDLDGILRRVTLVERAAQRVRRDGPDACPRQVEQLHDELVWVDAQLERGWDFAPLVRSVQDALARAGRTFGLVTVGAVAGAAALGIAVTDASRLTGFIDEVPDAVEHAASAPPEPEQDARRPPPSTRQRDPSPAAATESPEAVAHIEPTTSAPSTSVPTATLPEPPAEVGESAASSTTTTTTVPTRCSTETTAAAGSESSRTGTCRERDRHPHGKQSQPDPTTTTTPTTTTVPPTTTAAN